MSNGNLIICDPEEGYAQALAYYLMHKKEFGMEVQVYDRIEKVQEIADRTKIQILFAAAEYEAEERKKVPAEQKFLLTGAGNSQVLEDETALYKYQSGEKIVKLLLENVDAQESENILLGQAAGKQAVRLIGVYSPVHRIGKTSYALKLGEELAVNANVLYLNLELYSGIGGHFAGEGQTLSDLLYYARQEKGNLGLFLTTIVQHRRHLDYAEDIDYERHIIYVNFREDNENRARAKNAEFRRAKISDATFDILMFYIEDYKELILGQEYLFINVSGDYVGQPFKGSGVYAMLRRLERKTGIKASPHMLRHYFANARRKDGWKLEMISQALGHRNIETTMKYLNITEDELIEVSDAFYNKHQALYGVQNLL